MERSKDLAFAAQAMDNCLVHSVKTLHTMEINGTIAKSFRINTITILLRIGQFNFKQFLDICTQDNPFQQLGLVEGEWSINHTPKFYNCIFLKNKLDRASIKIFRNGNLHLTGIKSVGKALEYGRQLRNIIQPFSSENLEVQEFDIQLINGAFKFALPDDTAFYLTTMFSILKSKLDNRSNDQDVQIDCLFNNDYHSALKIKFIFTQDPRDSTTTVSIFKSGSVLIQSFRNGDQLIFVYKYVVNLICDNFDEVIAPDPKVKTKTKRNFDYASYLYK